MSLFAEYIKERGGKEIVESDKGFATYYYVNGGCYIEDIYVKEEFRKSGEASRLADEISEIAKSKGFKMLYGTVCPSTNASTSSLRILLAYGFNLDSSINNLIVMKKELM